MYHIIRRLILLTLTCITLLIMVSNILINEQAWKRMTDDFRNEKEDQILFYFNNRFRELSSIVSNHANWSEALAYLNDGNHDWLETNATSYLFDTGNDLIDYIYVSDEAGNYQSTYGETFGPEDYDSLFDTIFQSNLPSENYFWHQQELYLLSGMPFSEDDGTMPTGAYIVGFHVDANALLNLGAILDEEYVQSITISQKPFYAEFETHKYQTIQMSIPIYDQYSQIPLAYVNIHFDLPIFRYIFRTTELYTFVILIFFNIIIIGIALFIMKKVDSSLSNTIGAIEAISSGDFSNKLDTNKNLLVPELAILSEAINKMSTELESRLSQIDLNYLQMVDLISNGAKINDPYTHEHNRLVSKKAIQLATYIGYPNIHDVELAGLFHDIGKMAMPNHLLNKPGALTEDEYEIIKEHAMQSYQFIKNTDFSQEIKDGILYHHERYNGSGYPIGLRQHEIPRIAQIIGLLDYYVALISDRPYRRAYSKEKAFDILNQERDNGFDSKLITALIEIESNTTESYPGADT